ncbi:MAG: hypothetical protein IT329_05420 [Caldilineaceae bacterium]|nr:hypothetical protein [Caldilineaceae bacterium]
MYVALNAWREILARIFADFDAQENVSPPWLINPATRRRLKLDCYYANAGVAVRFVGLKAKGQGRQSDWEVLEEEQRDQTRLELCQANGVQLFLVDGLEDPLKQLDALIRLLSRAGRVLAQSDRPVQEKIAWQPRVSQARDQAEAIRRLVQRQPEQMMANLADSWRDREINLSAVADPLPMPTPTVDMARLAVQLRTGLRVAHVKFGSGVVTALAGDGDDARVSILFDGDQERTFLVNLVYDKLAADR